MNRDRFKLYDHVVVIDQGAVLGVASVQHMLDALARVQVEMAKGANPLTGLPGNVALEQEIERRGNAGEPVSFIYVDLDNFKTYNDTYGFQEGDRMIRLVADMLRWAARRHGNHGDMVAHVGGDDYVVISTPDRAERICLAMVRCCARLLPKALHRRASRGRVHRGQGQGRKAGPLPPGQRFFGHCGLHDLLRAFACGAKGGRGEKMGQVQAGQCLGERPQADLRLTGPAGGGQLEAFRNPREGCLGKCLRPGFSPFAWSGSAGRWPDRNCSCASRPPGPRGRRTRT